MDRKPYDAAYKYLFSSPRIACQLLHSFVDIPLVKEIRPEDLELVEKSFISDELQRREADVIYKVNRGERSAYIYILMEFQSTPDKAIPVRMLNYITMFYDFLLRKSKAGKLPPVLPLLIYNGRRNWNVPLRLKELIEPHLPEKYIPHFEYYPIIEKDYSDETLLEINNLASAIMMVENSRYRIDIDEIAGRVAECLRREHIKDLRMFSKWFSRMFSDKKPELWIDFPHKGDNQQMFAETAQRIKQDLLNEGIEQGEMNEKHEVLIRLVDLKFGLTEDEKDRIRNVQSPVLLDSALDAFATDEDKQGLLALLS
ncbi:MAG: Rpn family recombination-promoting nuclease/putative transposase [Spirochaetaceae bacterium]|nr:Rpn family recombination-promoting nuclease/putative transposase [Spirochaetaceae bacterium]